MYLNDTFIKLRFSFIEQFRFALKLLKKLFGLYSMPISNPLKKMQKSSLKKVIGRQFFAQVVKIVDPILHNSVNFGNPTVAF
jgi:hypothetical protein